MRCHRFEATRIRDENIVPSALYGELDLEEICRQLPAKRCSKAGVLFSQGKAMLKRSKTL